MRVRLPAARRPAQAQPASRLPASIPRLVRFGLTGGAAGLVQLGLLRVFEAAGAALLNMLVFATARTRVPDLMASALGIGVAAIANYLLADRLVFRTARPAPYRPSSRRHLTLAGERRAA
jgi:putative flippase GtrA